MEKITISEPINVLCMTASSFPDGVLAAHQGLHKLVPPGNGRRYYGLSRPEHGVITYKAAAEETRAGEAEEHGCEPLVIPAGTYLCVTITDFMKRIPDIGKTFQVMLTEPGIDPNGYCVEEYIDVDVRCMVRLA